MTAVYQYEVSAGLNLQPSFQFVIIQAEVQQTRSATIQAQS